MKYLVAFMVLGVFILLAGSTYQSSAAQAETARAALRAAEAAEAASIGQTVNSLLVGFLALVCVAMAGVNVYLAAQLNRKPRAHGQGGGQWSPQRFSYWGRAGQPAMRGSSQAPMLMSGQQMVDPRYQQPVYEYEPYENEEQSDGWWG